MRTFFMIRVRAHGRGHLRTPRWRACTVAKDLAPASADKRARIKPPRHSIRGGAPLVKLAALCPGVDRLWHASPSLDRARSQNACILTRSRLTDEHAMSAFLSTSQQHERSIRSEERRVGKECRSR